MPKTFGFWRCEYQIKGVRLKNGDYEDVIINGKETNGNDFEYYDPNDNGSILNLIFSDFKVKLLSK